LEKQSYIDFIDTYSAAFRREVFIKYGGYDSSFPVACAEDVELSYRMSSEGEKMVFQSKAQVYHTHPDTLVNYLKKKYKFAYWRVLAVKKNPQKAIKDSHTPQLMKIQLLFVPVLILSLLGGFLEPWFFGIGGFLLGLFFITTLPLVVRSFHKDKKVALFSPFLLLCRSIAQFFGVLLGSINLLF
jgi:GT2 family glycosyltransferase